MMDVTRISLFLDRWLHNQQISYKMQYKSWFIWNFLKSWISKSFRDNYYIYISSLTTVINSPELDIGLRKKVLVYTTVAIQLVSSFAVLLSVAVCPLVGYYDTHGRSRVGDWHSEFLFRHRTVTIQTPVHEHTYQS